MGGGHGETGKGEIYQKIPCVFSESV